MNETANEDKRCGSFLLLRCGDVTISSDWRQVGGAGGQWRTVTSQGVGHARQPVAWRRFICLTANRSVGGTLFMWRIR